MPESTAVDETFNQSTGSLSTKFSGQVVTVDYQEQAAKGILANALEAIAQSGSTDQLRGYANSAIGEAKLNLGLAVGSPELALLGLAQKALGEAQKYIGEAKISAETEGPSNEIGEVATNS